MKTKNNNLQEIDRRNNPFKVPENYFSQFNEDIMKKLPEKEFETEYIASEPISLWDKVKPWIYLAAMFIGMYFIIDFMANRTDGTDDESNMIISEQISPSTPRSDNYWSTVQMSEEEFYQYLEEQLVDDSYFDYMYHQYYLN